MKSEASKFGNFYLYRGVLVRCVHESGGDGDDVAKYIDRGGTIYQLEDDEDVDFQLRADDERGFDWRGWWRSEQVSGLFPVPVGTHIELGDGALCLIVTNSPDDKHTNAVQRVDGEWSFLVNSSFGKWRVTDVPSDNLSRQIKLEARWVADNYSVGDWIEHDSGAIGTITEIIGINVVVNGTGYAWSSVSKIPKPTSFRKLEPGETMAKGDTFVVDGDRNHLPTSLHGKPASSAPFPVYRVTDDESEAVEAISQAEALKFIRELDAGDEGYSERVAEILGRVQ